MFKPLLKATLVAGLVFSLGGVAQVLPPAEPANILPVKQALQDYVKSGGYNKGIAAVALEANKFLVKRLAKGAKPGQKLAVVFDIDETTLSNLSQILARDFGYVERDWNTWVAAGRAPAIIPVQTVYDVAVRNKVDVFFITGRREEDRSATERNLRDVGYDTWTKIFFKPTDDPDLTTKGFKIDTRRKLAQQGYIIVANIGDQESDLLGGYCERWFKLPNPFYITK